MINDIASKTGYKSNLDFNSIIPRYRIGLSRHTQWKKAIELTESGLVPIDVITAGKLNEIPGMSLNVYGGKYQPLHNKYRVKRSAAKYWTGETVNPEDYSDDIEIIESPVMIYFIASDLHNYRFPYSHQTQNSKDIKMLAVIKTNGGYTVQSHFTTSIEHKPTLCNYWHAEFHLLDEEGNYISRKNVTSSGNEPKSLFNKRDIITRTALDQLLQKCARIILSPGEYDTLPEEEYNN